MFFRGSRYEHVPTAEYVTEDGRVIPYKSLRPIPPTPGLTGHVVDDGERIDRLAFAEVRDPERFWRIADANVVIDARDLLAEPGRVIDIPEAG